tara:strand:- start:414 stop:878 length:465 start_codon:yes stop_codon:yes gene_type:complete
MNTDNILYIGIKLSNKMIDKLGRVIKFKHNHIYCDHVTLWLNRKDKPINKKIRDYLIELISSDTEYMVYFKGSRLVCDEKCQALEVKGVKHLMADDRTPHITLNTDGIVKPKYSNDLLQLNDNYKLGDSYYESDPVDIALEGNLFAFKISNSNS